MIAPSLEMSDDPEKKVKKCGMSHFFRIFEVSLRDGIAAYFSRLTSHVLLLQVRSGAGKVLFVLLDNLCALRSTDDVKGIIVK
jgi:hypothetical protein